MEQAIAREQTNDQSEHKSYEKEGNIFMAMNAFLVLTVTVALATFLNIFMGVLGGQIYQTSQSQLSAITNTNISNYINSGIQSGFQAQSQTASYTSLLVLVLIMGIMITVLFSSMSGFGLFGGYGGGRGGMVL